MQIGEQRNDYEKIWAYFSDCQRSIRMGTWVQTQVMGNIVISNLIYIRLVIKLKGLILMSHLELNTP